MRARDEEADAKVLALVAKGGEDGAFITHWKRWLRAEELVERKLLRRRMVCASRTHNQQGKREFWKPKFWITTEGKKVLAARGEPTS